MKREVLHHLEAIAETSGDMDADQATPHSRIPCPGGGFIYEPPAGVVWAGDARL